jgi:hypothetical protein
MWKKREKYSTDILIPVAQKDAQKNCFPEGFLISVSANREGAFPWQAVQKCPDAKPPKS